MGKLTASVDARQASRTGCAAHTETVPTTEVDCAVTRERRVNAGRIERYITARMYVGMLVVSNCLMKDKKKKQTKTCWRQQIHDGDR
jgi:hypothetical protein